MIVSRMPIFLYEESKLAYRLCVSFAKSAEPGSIAFVVGPGGCGKSSLAENLPNEVFGNRTTWPMGKIPVVNVVADNGDRGFFTTKSLIESFLKEVMSPFDVSESDVAKWDVPADIRQAVASIQRGARDASETKLRKAFIGIAIKREVKLILIDEANLLVLTQSGRVPTDYVESIRLLAMRIGCAVILLGTVDMLQLMGHSGQLNRRNLDIHAERMRCETEKSKLEFLSFLAELEKINSLPNGLLTEHASDIYSATYGIPGEIIGALKRADIYREANEAETMDWETIRKSFHNKIKRLRMKAEADLIRAVIEGNPLSKHQKDALKQQGRRNRINPQRLSVGE